MDAADKRAYNRRMFNGVLKDIFGENNGMETVYDFLSLPMGGRNATGVETQDPNP